MGWQWLPFDPLARVFMRKRCNRMVGSECWLFWMLRWMTVMATMYCWGWSSGNKAGMERWWSSDCIRFYYVINHLPLSAALPKQIELKFGFSIHHFKYISVFLWI